VVLAVAPAARGDQDVRRLDVAVDEALGVRGRERARDRGPIAAACTTFIGPSRWSFVLRSDPSTYRIAMKKVSSRSPAS